MHKILIAITDQAQDAALRAGEPAATVQTYDLPPELIQRALDLQLDAGVDTGVERRIDSGGALTLLCGVQLYGSDAPRRHLASRGALPRRPRDAADALDLIEEQIAARRAEAAAERAKRAAKEREAATRMIAVDPADLPAGFVDNVDSSYLVDDPDLLARLTAWRAEREAERERKEREREAEHERKEREREAAKESLRLYALEIDHLARAAREGYEVSCAVVDHVVDRLIEAVETAATTLAPIVLKEGSRHYDRASWEERVAPSARAFADLDRVRKAVEATPRPAAIDVQVLKIVRYEETPADGDDGGGEGERYTAVIVRVSTIACKRERVIVFRAEE